MYGRTDRYTFIFIGHAAYDTCSMYQLLKKEKRKKRKKNQLLIVKFRACMQCSHVAAILAHNAANATMTAAVVRVAGPPLACSKVAPAGLTKTGRQ